jgi:hypothetical protein
LASALAFGEQAEERLAGDLGRRVPHRHVERSDGDRPLAVASRLLVRHHGGPDPVRIEIVAALVEKALGSRLQDAVAEALADEAALAVASVRVEAVADDAPPVAHDVRDDRHEARGHLREIDVGVPDRRGDRLGDLANVDDAHVGVSLCRGRAVGTVELRNTRPEAPVRPARRPERHGAPLVVKGRCRYRGR